MFLLGARKLVGVALLGALAAAVPLFAQTTGGVKGRCVGEDGKELVGYTILVERQELKWTSKVKTDKHGEYIHLGLAGGTYKLTLLDPEGRVVISQIQHLGIGEPIEANFDLGKIRAIAAQADPEYRKAIEAQAKEQKEFTGLKQVFDQGQALYVQQKYAEAATLFEQALPLAKEKNVPVVLARLADAYGKAAAAAPDRDAKVKDEGKALEYFQKALEANPTDPALHNNLGSLYAEMGKTAEAQAEFQKAAEMDPPGASRYYYNLGVIMYNKGRMDEAAAALKKCTDIDPKFAEAYYHEALALLGKATLSADGKVVPVPGTVEALETYLKLDPNGKYAAAAKESLQLLSGSVSTEYKAPTTKKKKGS